MIAQEDIIKQMTKLTDVHFSLIAYICYTNDCIQIDKSQIINLRMNNDEVYIQNIFLRIGRLHIPYS